MKSRLLKMQSTLSSFWGEIETVEVHLCLSKLLLMYSLFCGDLYHVSCIHSFGFCGSTSPCRKTDYHLVKLLLVLTSSIWGLPFKRCHKFQKCVKAMKHFSLNLQFYRLLFKALLNCLSRFPLLKLYLKLF